MVLYYFMRVLASENDIIFYVVRKKAELFPQRRTRILNIRRTVKKSC